jgi:hypothetical protein
MQLPNLDDRRYADLVEEARGLIPTYAPEWTNHNPSDPGVTLLELFAALSEMLIYRLNRVTPANVLAFLKLLNGPGWQPLGKDPAELTAAEIAAQVPVTILALRKRDRAVSMEDFELLAREADSRVARARALPRLNMNIDPEQERAGHVSVIVVPRSPAEPDLPGLLAAVADDLRPKLLLTTRLHVVGPRFATVGFQVTVMPLPDEFDGTVKTRIVQAVRRFLAPLVDPDDGTGWPFGRNVFVSEMYRLIDQLSGIDFVQSITLVPATPDRAITGPTGEMIGVEVKPYELVDAQIVEADVTVLTP